MFNSTHNILKALSLGLLYPQIATEQVLLFPVSPYLASAHSALSNRSPLSSTQVT